MVSHISACGYLLFHVCQNFLFKEVHVFKARQIGGELNFSVLSIRYAETPYSSSFSVEKALNIWRLHSDADYSYYLMRSVIELAVHKYGYNITFCLVIIYI